VDKWSNSKQSKFVSGHIDPVTSLFENIGMTSEG